MQPPEPTAFEAQRPRLLRLAYRMLGSHAEAEDVVQDAWLRWSRMTPGSVDNAAAFLTRIATRLCLDRMKSAAVRRETYYGEWLPEPLVEPDRGEMRADDLTLTLMLALERLSPLERAAFLLHDIFDLPMGDVAAALERDPAAVRQLASRARRHVRDARPRYPIAASEAERIASAFFAASRDGDTDSLRTMLAEDVVLYSDGGGKVLAFRNPIYGLARALRLFAGLRRKHAARAETFLPLRIDGLAGFATIAEGVLLQTTALEVADGRISAIYIMRNPDKLARLATALNVAAP